jgi:hypothetical protein
MEANSFAGHFLMPNEGFSQEWEKYRGMRFIDSVLKIKCVFRVSYLTVLYRLYENKIIDKYYLARNRFIADWSRGLGLPPFHGGCRPYGLLVFRIPFFCLAAAWFSPQRSKPSRGSWPSSAEGSPGRLGRILGRNEKKACVDVLFKILYQKSHYSSSGGLPSLKTDLKAATLPTKGRSFWEIS